MLPMHNQMVNVSDLARLNDVLRKSGAAVGYQEGAVPDAGASLSPLVPQSIEATLSSATYGMSELALWQNIPKTNVTQTLHEYVVVREHGMDLDPFIGEGGGGSADFATNVAEYERKSVRIKYMAERRQVSDVASLVGLVGDNREAIAEETMRGTMNLMRKVEKQLWYGREELNSKGFDGILKQMSDNAPANVYDLNGKSPSPLLLQEVLGEVYSAPNFGRPDCIYVEPRVHAELIKQSVEGGRHDQLAVRDSSQLTYGVKDLFIQAPYGAVPIKAAPFLHFAGRMPAAGFGDTSTRPAAPVVSVAAAAAANASSNFVAGDAGDYRYSVVAINDNGYSDPVTVSAGLAVASGDSVSFTLAAASDALYYRIYRSSADGAASTLRLIKEIPAARAAGAAVATAILDHNDGADGQKYECSPIVFAQHDPSVLQFSRLLDFIRRPLAETASIRPFLLMMFGSPIVKVPTKMFVLNNAGISSTGNFRA